MRARPDVPPRAARRPLASPRHPSSATVEKNPVDAVPAEIRHQPAQPRFRALEVEVMAESRLCPNAFYTRLIGIELPRVEIKHRGLAVDVVDAANGPARDKVRQQAKIPAAARGPVLAAVSYTHLTLPT